MRPRPRGAGVAVRERVRIARAVVVVALAAGAPARADGFIPPMDASIGWQAARTDGAPSTDRVAMIGLSWATLDPYDTAFDVGLGYLRADADEARMATRGGTTMDAGATLNGGYAYLGLRVGSGRGWRSFASARIEAGSGDDTFFLGGAVRISAEAWAGLPDTCAHGPHGVFGVGALGLWVEAGRRSRGDLESTFVAAGLSLRVPFVGVPPSGHCCNR